MSNAIVHSGQRTPLNKDSSEGRACEDLGKSVLGTGNSGWAPELEQAGALEDYPADMGPPE